MVKHWAVLLGFLELAQGFLAPQGSAVGLRPPRTLHRLHADDDAGVRQAKWLESLKGLDGGDANDADDAGGAPSIVPFEVSVEQAGLGAAALAAALTVALDIGFLGGAAAKLELAAAMGFLANAWTTRSNKGSAGDLLESAGTLVAKTAAAANDAFQDFNAPATPVLAAEAESLVAKAAGAGAAASAAAPAAGAAAGPAAEAGEEILSAIGVRGGLAASESATRRLMRAPSSSDDPGSGAMSSPGTPALANAAGVAAPRAAPANPGSDVAFPRLTTAAKLGNMPLKEALRRACTGQVSRSAVLRLACQRAAQSKVARLSLAVLFAAAVYAATGTA